MTTRPAYSRILARNRLHLRPLNGTRLGPDLAADVRTGLSCRPKRLPPKYFYDQRGSQLFEAICGTPEYYPTRTEEALLAQVAEPIIDRVRPTSILELGSGSSRKTRHLLRACDRLGCFGTYLPVDVCRGMMLEAGEQLLAEYRWLDIEGLVGDYCQGLGDLPQAEGPRLFVFLGGTIGNFEDGEAVAFLRDVRAAMGRDDWLLLGVDRVKDEAVLHAAYNDAAGHTAAFNLNVLAVINRELNADFDLSRFRHEARYDAGRERIEMYLRAVAGHRVAIHDLSMSVEFERHEAILTEISRKFTPASMGAMLAQAGFVVDRHDEPANGYFSLALARPVAGRVQHRPTVPVHAY